LSSAILYLGIVVIWACVLIPRWLRRDSVASSGQDSWDESTEWEAESAEEAPTVEESVPAPASPDDGHRKVLAARRRMLGMLSALVLGAAVLAFTKLAAWWVIVPPTIMMGGYLILLREAAHADAERVAASAQASARAEAAAHDAAAREAATREAATREAAARDRVVETPPDAEIIDISSQVGEEFYDQYTDARLRAVGD
jgi:hypothetical protein